MENSDVKLAKTLVERYSPTAKKAIGVLIAAACEATARSVRTAYEEGALSADDADEREFNKYANYLQRK